jgi:LAS superfamily LD-carboxypeptidase LdcB
MAVGVAVVAVAACVVIGQQSDDHERIVAGGAATVVDGSGGERGSEGGADQLSPAVVRAFTKAQGAAAAEGVTVTITSGWRSAADQQRLYQEAIAKYGSPEEARHWVLPPNESAHVRGEAIDVGPPAGAAWLAEHGVRFGLCQAYANEAWHFELLAPALGQECPAMRPHA